LSIDLFANLKNGSKDQEQVEKRFLFEILPYVYNVKVSSKDDMQNITLAIWLDQIQQAKNGVIFEDKKQRTIITPNFNSNIVKETNTIEEKSEEPLTQGLLLETLKQECLVKLRNGDRISDVHQYFRSEIKNTTDTSDKDKKEYGSIWGSIIKEFKETPLKDVITPENKEEIIAAAEEAASKGVENLTEDVVKSNVKHIILEGLRGNVKSAMNAVRQYLSVGPVRKLLKDVKVSDYYKSLKDEVIKENPNVSESKVLRPIAKDIDLAKEHPDVLESVNLCNNIEELRQLVIDIVFNKNTMFKDAYTVGYAVTKAKLTKFEGQENWDQPTIDTWFKDVIRTETSLRKQEKETVSSESQTIIEESPKTSEEIKEELEKELTSTPKDFSYISDMKKADTIRNTVVELMKKGEKLEDMAPFIFKSLPFMSCKNKPAEQEKVLKNIEKLYNKK